MIIADKEIINSKTIETGNFLLFTAIYFSDLISCYLWQYLEFVISDCMIALNRIIMK